MALALESINPKIVAEMATRAHNPTKWMEKAPWSRIVSYAVPKGGPTGDHVIDNLRMNNILYGGALGAPQGENIVGYQEDSQGVTEDVYAQTLRTDFGYADSYRSNRNTGLVPSSGRSMAPTPGIVSLNVSNKGSYGSLREVKLQLKAFDLDQLSTIEALYMTPGISILVEWGWARPGKEPPYRSIDNDSLKNIKSFQAALSDEVKYGDNAGNYDAAVATITTYSWNAQKDGTYDIAIEAVSRGETMLNMPIKKANSRLLDVIENLSNVSEASRGMFVPNELKIPVWHYDWAKSYKASERLTLEQQITTERNAQKMNTSIMDKAKQKKEYANIYHFAALCRSAAKYRLPSYPTSVGQTSLNKQSKDLYTQLFSGRDNVRIAHYVTNPDDAANGGHGRYPSYMHNYVSSPYKHGQTLDPADLNVGIEYGNKIYRPMFVGKLHIDTAKNGVFQDRTTNHAKLGISGFGNLGSSWSNYGASFKGKITSDLQSLKDAWGKDSKVHQPAQFYADDYFSKSNPTIAPDPEVWSVPQSSTDSDKTVEIDLSATSDLMEIMGVSSRGQVANEKGEDLITSGKNALYKYYLHGTDAWGAVPRLPIYIETQDDSAVGDNNANVLAAVVWAHIDLQEWNPAEGTFQCLIDAKDARSATSTNANSAVNSARKDIGTSNVLIDRINDDLENLEAKIGEYIPISGIERLLNNTTNLRVGGKERQNKSSDTSGEKLYRFDSGFLEYGQDETDLKNAQTVTTDEERGKILKEYGLLFAMYGGGDVQTGRKLFYTDSWEPIRSLPVKINNHRDLKTTNPDICLIPGQEFYSPSWDVKSNIKKTNYSGPNNYEWNGAIGQADKPDPFAFSSTSVDGFVSNILVHTDLIKNFAKRSNNVLDFYKGILQEVSKACGDRWSFGIQIDADNDYIARVVDLGWHKQIVEQGDTIWTFPLWGYNGGIDAFDGLEGHILRDFTLESKIPNDMKLMALYGQNAHIINQQHLDNPLYSIQGTAGLMWQDLSLVDIVSEQQAKLTEDGGDVSTNSKSFAFDESSEGDSHSRDDDTITGKLPVTLEKQRERLQETLHSVHINGPKSVPRALRLLEAVYHNKFPFSQTEWEALIDEVGEKTAHERAAEIDKQTREKLLSENPIIFRNIIPLDCSLTIDGLSGIYFGNSFTLTGLPEKYYKASGEPLVCFQITNVSHTIDSNGWATVITGMMRTPPDGSLFKNIITGAVSGDIYVTPSSEEYLQGLADEASNILSSAIPQGTDLGLNIPDNPYAF